MRGGALAPALRPGRAATVLRGRCARLQARCAGLFPFGKGLFGASKGVNSNTDYVVLGGGVAAGYLVRELADAGLARGRVCVVSEEPVAPYERPALSKAVLAPKGARLPAFHTCVGTGAPAQGPEWYAAQGVELLLSTRASLVDANKKWVVLDDGGLVTYDKLFVATGCRPRALGVPGEGSLRGVHAVKSVQDTDALLADLEEANPARVVVVGGGFLGVEVAAALANNFGGLRVTIVAAGDSLLDRVWPNPDVSKHYEGLFRAKGVELVFGETVLELEGGDRVAGVVLASGRRLEAGLVVVAVGSTPNVEALEGAVELAGPPLGGIKVDGRFRTSAEGVYAVGDVAAFPGGPQQGGGAQEAGASLVRVEHVDHARRSAAHVVACMRDPAKAREYRHVPYCYSRFFDRHWQLHGETTDAPVVVGDFAPKLAAFFLDRDDGRIRGVFLEGGTPDEFALARAIAQAKPIRQPGALASAPSVEDALDVAHRGL